MRENPVFTLELARAHINDLHREAAGSHRNAVTHHVPAGPSRLRRLISRATR
ncbi:MAG: hypothetical protein ACXV2H_00680 [Actinomycetes bacterium]